MVINIDDIKSIESIELKVVYDLTIESNSNYFIKTNTDKILVHNSGKTYSGIDFLIYICSTVETSATINIVKETYNSFKTTLYRDFNNRLPQFGIPSPFQNVKEVSSFKLFGNNIHLLGADKESKFHGAGSEYTWYNEALYIPKGIFDHTEQRCSKFIFLDYNPNATDHYVYNSIITRPEIDFIKTTFLDNPYISEWEKKKILSYDPGNPENIKNGTADDYMWKVYGLGERSMPEGLIFQYVEYIDKFPDVGFWYGLDFGFTNDPTALVKCAIIGKNIYFELLCYEPIESPEILNNYFEKINIEHWKPITADSSDKYSNDKGTVEMVRDMKTKGWKVTKVSKTKDLNYWISKMKEYKIHIVMNHLGMNAKKEQQNYKWRMINGISINQPIDDYNHFWDAARYAFMSSFKKHSPIS